MKMIKILTVNVMCIIMACVSISSAFAVETDKSENDAFTRPSYGDANHDHVIDLHDVVVIQKHLAGLNGFKVCRKCANVDGDEISLQDVVCIQRHLAGLKSNSECGKEADKYSGIQPLELDEKTKEIIEKAYTEFKPLSQEEIDSIIKWFDKLVDCTYYGTLQDGTPLVHAIYAGMSYPSIEAKTEIGDYIYYGTTCLILDGKYISIKDAYEQGLLSEEIFKELVFELHMMKK